METTAKITPQTSYTIEISGYKYHNCTFKEKWEGFLKFKTSDQQVIIVVESETEFEKILCDIISEKPSKTKECQIAKASPSVLEKIWQRSTEKEG